MTAIPGDHMTEGQRELEASIRALILKYAFRGLALFGGAIVVSLIWVVRMEGKTEANWAAHARDSVRIEQNRTEGSLPLQSLKTEMAVLQEAMRNLTNELQRTQATIRGNR